MFFIRMRSRGSRKLSLHICANGTPRKFTSSRMQAGIERPGGIVEQVAALAHFADVARVGLRVHRDHQVVIERARGVAVLIDADLVPGGQALNVRREKILAGNRNAHAEDRLHEQSVGAGRSGSVYVGQFDGEVVYAGTHESTLTGLPA